MYNTLFLSSTLHYLFFATIHLSNLQDDMITISCYIFIIKVYKTKSYLYYYHRIFTNDQFSSFIYLFI